MDVPASALPCPNAARPIAMPTGVVMAKVKASVGLNALRIHLAKKNYLISKLRKMDTRKWRYH